MHPDNLAIAIKRRSFLFVVWINAFLFTVNAVNTCFCFWERDFAWMTVPLIFATGFLCLAISEIIEKAHEAEAQFQRDNLKRERAEAVFSLMDELGIGCSGEELVAVSEGSLSLLDLRERLLKRRQLLWSHVRTDCRYFSKSSFIKCAVNPSGSCQECRDYESGEFSPVS